MKKFILGFITGGMLAAAVTGFAVEYAITVNPYPIKVNGQAAAIEGYNINDSSYFKLRDIADALGGFNVEFKDNTIVLETETAPTPTPAPDIAAAKTDLSPLPELPTETRGGVQYVSAYKIEDMLEALGLGQYKFALHDFVDKNDLLNPLLTNIPRYEQGIDLIPLDYYTSTIVPVINSLR